MPLFCLALTAHTQKTGIYGTFYMQSVSQIGAQIKLLDVWKAHQNERYPTKYQRRNDNNPEQRTRSAAINKLEEAYGGKILTSTSINDAAKL